MQLEPWTQGARAVPVLAAALVIALGGTDADQALGWLGFLTRLGLVMLALLLPLGAHLLACRLPPMPAVMAWCAGFVVYPVLAILAGLYLIGPWQWGLAALFSAAYLLLHPGARSNGQTATAGTPAILSLPITLDATFGVLLSIWALGVTTLFASTEDAVRNQPLPVQANLSRMADNPGETLWYLAQFALLAAVLFGWYWICRYGLVRRVLQRHGLVPFGFGLVGLIGLGAPLAATIGLALPLNIPEWTIIPSENHDPFDATNFRFALWITVIVVPVILAVERLQAEQVAATRRHDQIRAELHVLQEQINPHFLFNTLNTLYALCLKDRGAAAAAIVKLSDLLRYSVYQGQAERVPLDEELGYLRNYLDLQHLRFGHRCRVALDLPADPTGFCLPPLMLIMLVENAFKHGVEPAGGDCDIAISAGLSGARLKFLCTNTMPGSALPPQPGLGLANLRRRLELVFGADFRFESVLVDGRWQAQLEVALMPC